MSKDNSQCSTSAWDGTQKSWWYRRTSLEKKLIVALVSTVIIVLGFVIFAGIKPKVSVASDVCNTPACLEAASQIITHIDPDIDPCDDFFKFACGRFIRHIHGDIKAASINGVQEQVNRQYAEILKEPINDEDHYMVQNQKIIFQACMNETAVEEETIDLLKEHLKDLGGWPVVIGYKWKERYFHWTEMVFKLRKLGYFYQAIININIIPDPIDKNQFIIQMTPPPLHGTLNENKQLYIKYVTDVAMAFGATERERVEIEMEKVVDFRDRLKKIADKYYWNADNQTERNYTADLLQNRFKVKDFFQDYEDEVDWLQFLNTILDPVTISSNDYVIFPSNEYFQALMTLLYRTPNRIQANYIIWNVVESLRGYLTKEIKQLGTNYTCLANPSATPPKRFEFCKMISTRSFVRAPGNIIYARRYLPLEKKEQVQELLGFVKSEFKKILLEVSWMDDESRDNAIEKADELQEIYGVPGDYFDDAIFEEYQSINYTESESLLEMMLVSSKIQEDIQFSYLETPVNRSQNDLFYSMAREVNAMYSMEDNLMILPVGILQGIFYNSERPMYLNFGSIGSIMGHELTHGFCKDASKYYKYGKYGEMWTNHTKKAYDEATQCIIVDAESFEIEDTEQKINGTTTLEENIADFTGVRVAYAAYKNWVEENEEEPQLPGIDYTPYQLFWISAISHECYKLSGDRLEEGLEYDSHAHNAFRATGPMRNNEDFAVDFNCPVDSNMNPEEKCRVF